MLQNLEPRSLLSASMQVWDGSVQFTNAGNDSFGTATVNTQDSQTWTIKNVGDQTLTISSDSVPSGFMVQGMLPSSIGAGQQASVTVALNTNSISTYSGPFDLYTNDSSNDPFVLNLSGTVQSSMSGGTIEIFDGATQISNGGSDSFGSITVGSPETKSLTVKNVGSSTLTVSSVSFPTGYSSTTTTPFSVSPNQSATLSVTLSASAAGNFDGQMLVQNSDSSHNPFTVNLSGTVTTSSSASISLKDGTTSINNGGSDSFGTVVEGTSDTRTYTVTNVGTGTLTVSAISLPGSYSTTVSLPLNITAGNSTTFTVALATSSVGTFSGTMALTTNDPNNGTFNVSLSGTVTAPSVTIQASGATADELTGSPGQFTMTRSGGTASALTVTYTVGGTAVAGTDYTALTGTVTIPIGSATATIAVDPLTGGKINEVQQIVLPAPTGGTYTLSIGSGTTTALAYNANAAAVAAALGALASVGPGRVTVTGSGTSSDPFIVTFIGALGGANLPQITGDGSQLTGGTTITTSITTAGDDGGTVVASVASSANYTVGTPSQDTVTVLGDEPPVITVVATTPTANEVAGTAGEFTLYRNGPTTTALNVNYSLAGTATDGVDYTWISGTATFATGQATATIDIAPINNGLASADKTAILSLSASQSDSYSLAGANSDTVTITNGNLPVVTLMATAPTANEETGDAGEFTVTRNGAGTSALVVNYTIGGTAVAGTAYTALSGSVTIPAGSASATIDVAPIDDGGQGTNTSSTVQLSLVSSANYTIASANTDTVTITVNYTVSGTAISGTDFTAVGQRHDPHWPDERGRAGDPAQRPERVRDDDGSGERFNQFGLRGDGLQHGCRVDHRQHDAAQRHDVGHNADGQ